MLRAGRTIHEKMLVLPGPSAERLCQIIVSEAAAVVVCGVLEQAFYDYLTRKKISVIDNVIGNSRTAIARIASGRLCAGDILGWCA